MNQFNQEELKNLLILIGRAQITGQEATATAQLQHKIQQLVIIEKVAPVEEEPIKSVEEKENEGTNTQKG